MIVHFHTHFSTREIHSNIIHPGFYFYRCTECWSHHCGCEMSPALHGARSWRHGIWVSNHPLLALTDTDYGCYHTCIYHTPAAKRDRPVPCGSHQPPEPGDAVTGLAWQGLGKISVRESGSDRLEAGVAVGLNRG